MALCFDVVSVHVESSIKIHGIIKQEGSLYHRHAEEPSSCRKTWSEYRAKS